jgi:hypothetical protein
MMLTCLIHCLFLVVVFSLLLPLLVVEREVFGKVGALLLGTTKRTSMTYRDGVCSGEVSGLAGMLRYR